MRILHAYTIHRGGGGAENTVRATIELSRRHGFEIETLTEDSNLVPRTLAGRITTGIAAFHSPSSERRFRQAVESFRPDVVHVHDLFPLISPWILPACSRRGIPVVMSCSHYRLTCPVAIHFREGRICTDCVGGREYNALLNNCRNNLSESAVVSGYNLLTSRLGLFKKHVACFIAPSEFTRDWLVDSGGVDPSRIVAISPIVDPPDKPADPAHGSYVAFAGRFVPEKGVATFLDAAEIAGVPFRLSRNENHLVKAPIDHRVEVVVTRTPEELDAFYRNARMVVMPSIWFETFGLAAAEAMSRGIPAIVSRLGALENLVDDGVDGLHFTAGDPVDLAAKVRTLWDNPALCRKMGAAARRKAFALWRGESQLERLCDVYSRLVGASELRPAASAAR